MDTDMLERLRSRLQQARTEDQSRLDEIEVPPAADSAHTMETGEAGDAHRARAMRQQEEQASLHEETARRLAAVDRALERMDEGTYGTCEVCGAAIDEDRLDALPMTARCREHAPTEAETR